MAIDLNLLNQGFAQLGASDGGGDVLRALTDVHCDYVVVPDAPSLHGAAWLMERASLLDELLGQAGIEADDRRRWADRVQGAPRLLPHLIAHRWFGGPSLDEIPDDPGALPALSPGLRGKVEHYLDERLRETPAVPVIEGDMVAPEKWPARSVIVRGPRVIGVFDEKTLELDRWRGAVLSSAFPPFALPPLPPPAPMLPSPPPGTSTGAELPPFVAHPRITAEAPPRTGELLHFSVGLSDRPDAEADSQQRIVIADPQPDDTLTVRVSAEGAEIQEETLVQLALDLAAEHAFSARLLPGAARVVLCAQYFFRGRLLGSIAKTLAVQDAAPPAADAGSDASPDAASDTVRPLADAAELGAVDIRLFVERSDRNSEIVQWEGHDASGKKWGPFPVLLPDAQAFAKRLAGLRKVYGDSGGDANAELVGVGQDIAALIPKVILDELIVPALANGATPSVQILTDEPFVPWELARLSATQAGRGAHSFLGACARISRWWTRASSSGPPSQLRVEHLSAVAASAYSLGSNRAQLPCAVAEREALCATPYKAQPVEAVKADVDAWLDRKPNLSGHLAHIALHGYSDALAAQQGLVLGDGAVLTPTRLAGEWYAGEIPRFVMVFLNACQVGTAGELLGRMAGFPGALVRGGVSAFVAPLWEVQDAVASDVSRDFYQHTLVDGVEVGEALRLMRAGAAAGGSITPWAYLYYGHPRLRLERSP